MNKGRIIQLLAGVALAAAGLLFFFRDLDTRLLLQELRQISPAVIVWVIFLSLATLWLRSIRWKIILPLSPGAHKKGLFPIITIAYMVNNIMPARLGEAVRAAMLWKKNGYSLTTSIGSLLLERLIDSMVFLCFFFTPIFFSAALEDLRFYAFGTAAIVLALSLFFVFYAFFPASVKSFCLWLISFLPLRFRSRVEKILTELMENMNWLFSPAKVVAVLLLSFSVAFCYALIIFALSHGIDNFSLLDSMFGQAFAALGTAIPLAPGFIGTLHASLQFGLALTGVPPSDTAALVILYHALPYISVTVAGLFSLSVTNIKFKDISRADQEIKTTQKEADLL